MQDTKTKRRIGPHATSFLLLYRFHLLSPFLPSEAQEIKHLQTHEWVTIYFQIDTKQNGKFCVLLLLLMMM
jgi:hypothetical protein